VDEVVAQIKPETNQLRYFQYDARGHCVFQTDTSGQIKEQYEYDAFGLPYFYDDQGDPTWVSGQPGSPWGNRILFAGREYLSDMRIYDFRNRMYHPEQGRFLQPDPIGFGGEGAKALAYSLGFPRARYRLLTIICTDIVITIRSTKLTHKGCTMSMSSPVMNRLRITLTNQDCIRMCSLLPVTENLGG